ncbi:iron ABC transporter permease [Oscillospiraceae bacterium]|nr:iron ABC transporter permease [Oscillospiraceae bacterium]BDF74188.1 iron ABC transporter permease [Oscillospiraceae bacterium]
MLGLLIALAAAVVVSFALGRYPVPPRELVCIPLSRLFPIEPFWSTTMEKVFFNVRLPRILLACLVGCSLAGAGCAYQCIFQNPMASPDILGATKGSAFGASLAILAGLGSRWTVVASFCFGVGTVALVWLVSAKAKGKRVMSLILAGIIVSSLFEAGISYLKLVADPDEQLPKITYWLMGSLAGTVMEDVAFVVLPMAAGLVILLLLRWQLGVLTMGDEEARAMGVNAALVRPVILLAATLLTASSVAVCGAIGWVGLVVPHICRRLVGSGSRYLMPASMLFGALFLLLADDISRNLYATELPIGILTAFVGAPFFLYLMMRGGEST